MTSSSAPATPLLGGEPALPVALELSAPAHHTALSSLVATVAAWPATEPLQPFVERWIGRASRTGRMRDLVLGHMSDPLRLADPDHARRDLEELLRPLRRVGAAEPLTERAARRLLGCELRYVMELRDPEPELALPAGVLCELLEDLRAGLTALDGPVALRIGVAPAHAGKRDDDEDAASPPHVRLSLSIAAEQPLPASLRARAGALFLTSGSSAEAWGIGRDGSEGVARVDPRVASVLLTSSPVARGAKRMPLRPWDAKLSPTGAALGRVHRSSGRSALMRLSWEDRRHHALVFGSSGCGKSVTTLRIVIDDFEQERMVVVLDFHGDLADDVVTAAGPDRPVVIDAGTRASAPLDLLDPDPARATAHLIAAMSSVWPGEFMGPVWQRGMSLVLHTLAVGLDRRASLADVERFLIDDQWRAELIGRLPRGRLHAEAVRESTAWATQSSSSDTTTITWLAGKLTALTQGPAGHLFEHAPEHTLEDLLAHARGVVVKLPIGVLGADVARLIGSMLLTRLTTAISGQASVARDERRAVSIVIDEAHLVAGPALTGLFAQARKFNGSVTAATQSPSQYGAQLSTMLTNAQTLLLGRLPVREADCVVHRVGEPVVDILPTLPRHHLLVVGENATPAEPPLVLSPIPVPRLGDRA